MGERAVRHQQGGARTSETSAHDSRARQHHSIERDAATPRARSEFLLCADWLGAGRPELRFGFKKHSGISN